MAKGLFATFTNMAILAAVVGGIQLLAKAIDNLNHTYDELKEEVQSSTEEFKNLKSELSTLESQLKTNEDRIKELNSLPHLKLIEQEELDRLKESNDELREQIYLKGLDVERANRESQDDAIEFLSKEESYSAVSGFDNYGITTFEQKEGNAIDRTKWQIEEYERLIQLEKDLVAEKSKLEAEGADTEIIESELTVVDSQLKALEGRIPTLIKDIASMKASFVEGSTESATWLPQIEDLEDYYFDVFNVTFDNKDVQDKFDEVWNAVDFKKYRTELEEMARAGTLDASDLDGNENYQRLLESTGESAENLTEHIYATVSAVETLEQTVAKVDFSTALSNLPTDKLEEYIAIANNDGFNESNITSFRELNQILQETGVEYEDLNTLIKEWAEGENHKTTAQLADEIQGLYDILQDVKDEYSNTKQVSLDTLNSMISKYPELQYASNQYRQGLISGQELIAQLETAYANDVSAYQMATALKMETDESFFTKVFQNNQTFFNKLAEAYGLDVQNWKNTAQAKAEIEAALITKVSSLWSKFYQVQIDASTGLASMMSITKQGNDKDYYRLTAEEEAAMMVAYRQAEQYNKIINSLNEISADSIDIPDFGGIGNKSKSSSGSNSSSDKSTQKEIDWIERKNELLQREHDIKQEIANDESVSYAERKSAIQDLINQDKERVSIAEQSASEYEKKWNEAIANLKASDISKIMHGELVIDNYDSDELEKQGIADGKLYIENLEKALELYDLKEDVLQKQNDIEKESIEHQKESIRLLQDEIGYQKDLNSAMSDQVNSRIDLMQARGEYVTKGSYEELIRISKQMETLHQDNIDALYEQLNLEDEGSAEYYSILASIEECEDALIQCKVEQEEWNYKIQRLPIDRIQTYINMLEDIKEDATNWGSEISVDGISLNMEQYQQLIDLNAEEIDALVKQQDKLQKLLNNYQYGSDKFNEVSDEIQSVQNQMSSLIQEQKEYNYAILQIPIDEMAEQVEELANVKAALQNSIAEDNAKGIQTTIDQYKDLHSLTLQQIQLLVKQRDTLTSALDSYEEGSDKYKEVESQIDGISDSISGLVQETYKWNQEMLNIPIDRLEKLNGNLSSYSSILGDVISDYDSALDGINALIDGEIDGIQSILDGLAAQNKEIQIQRNLEQSLYDLRRAEQQRTTKVIRDGIVDYDLNSDALRSAKEQYADTEFEAVQFSLEKQIEQLETIRDKWQGIVEEIEKAKSLQDAEDLFGADSKWKESILTGSDDALYEMLQTLYKSTTEQKEFVDSQIESNDRISQMMNEFVTRYQEGSITYEQALSGINNMIQSMEGGYTALENLSEMMNLDNIDGLENIASSTQEQINQSADLLKQYVMIVEANKQSVEGFETNWSEVSGSIGGIIDSFDNAVSSIGSYISTFEKNTDAINENTKTWDEMKASIKNQAEALKKAAEELEKLANAKKTSSSSGNRGSSSSSGSVSSGGSTIWAGGEAHSESKGSTAEIIGQFGTQAEKDRYAEYRQQQIDNNPNASNKAWKEAAVKALQEELKNANVKKYHDGIKNGYVGGNTIKLSDMPDDKLWNYAYKIALDKLRTDEVFAILKKGEGVLTPNQMQNVISNSEMVGRAGASVIGEVPVHKNLQNSYDCSIGEIHLHEVQDVDGFAKALDQHFASTMKQQMSKYKLSI